MEKLSINKENNPVYTALFVKDISELLKKFPPKHPNVFGHHTTIAFLPGDLDGINVGEEKSIKILGRAFDEKGDALLVENPKSKNKYPHITLSCVDGVGPAYSNELLDKAIRDEEIEYFDGEVINVVEGYFDGEKDIVE